LYLHRIWQHPPIVFVFGNKNFNLIGLYFIMYPMYETHAKQSIKANKNKNENFGEQRIDIMPCILNL
jgi:hypothetical protein